MPLGSLRFRSLHDLLRNLPIAEEDQETRKLIGKLAHVKDDHRLSRAEFLDICSWKSPRSVAHCRRNSAASIAGMCKALFRTRSEKKKLELLTNLSGVSVPTASAILTLTNPERYGVIDIRVWQLLYALGSVSDNPRGLGFTYKHWNRYLLLLRFYSKKLRVSARLVELTLFRFHQDHQSGTLYARD